MARKCVAPDHALAITYRECEVQLGHLVEETDLFILELFRHYPGGTRAEGVTLAQRLALRGKASLIVSPLYVPALQQSGYWDVACGDTLEERIQKFVANPRLALEKLDELAKYFGAFLEIPPQHETHDSRQL